MKRKYVLMLVVAGLFVVALALAACAGPASTTTTKTTTPPVTTTTKPPTATTTTTQEPAPKIPHALDAAHTDCRNCHANSSFAGAIPQVPKADPDHTNFTNSMCAGCHKTA